MIYRTVSCETWGDPWFADLSAPGKLVFLYLFTNARTTAAGVYEITTRQIAFDTALDEDQVCELLRVDLANKVRWWPDLRIVWVCNFFKRQAAQSNSNNFAIGARKALSAFPPHVQAAVYAFYPELAPIPIPSTYGVEGSVSHPQPIPTPPVYVGDKETVTESESVTATEQNTPTESQAPHTGATAPKTRGTRLPDRFLLTADMRSWAAANTPGVDVRAETEAFCDYWRAVPGAKGCKLDWPATWRNWMRQEYKKLVAKTKAAKATTGARNGHQAAPAGINSADWQAGGRYAHLRHTGPLYSEAPEDENQEAPDV